MYRAFPVRGRICGRPEEEPPPQGGGSMWGVAIRVEGPPIRLIRRSSVALVDALRESLGTQYRGGTVAAAFQ